MNQLKDAEKKASSMVAVHRKGKNLRRSIAEKWREAAAFDGGSALLCFLRYLV